MLISELWFRGEIARQRTSGRRILHRPRNDGWDIDDEDGEVWDQEEVERVVDDDRRRRRRLKETAGDEGEGESGSWKLAINLLGEKRSLVDWDKGGFLQLPFVGFMQNRNNALTWHISPEQHP